MYQLYLSSIIAPSSIVTTHAHPMGGLCHHENMKHPHACCGVYIDIIATCNYVLNVNFCKTNHERINDFASVSMQHSTVAVEVG